MPAPHHNLNLNPETMQNDHIIVLRVQTAEPMTARMAASLVCDYAEAHDQEFVEDCANDPDEPTEREHALLILNHMSEAEIA
jgi:hypothetical protein